MLLWNTLSNFSSSHLSYHNSRKSKLMLQIDDNTGCHRLKGTSSFHTTFGKNGYGDIEKGSAFSALWRCYILAKPLAEWTYPQIWSIGNPVGYSDST